MMATLRARLTPTGSTNTSTIIIRVQGPSDQTHRNRPALVSTLITWREGRSERPQGDIRGIFPIASQRRWRPAPLLSRRGGPAGSGIDGAGKAGAAVPVPVTVAEAVTFASRSPQNRETT